VDLVLVAVDTADTAPVGPVGSGALPAAVGRRLATEDWAVAYHEREVRPGVLAGLDEVPTAVLDELGLEDVVQRHPGGNVLVLAAPATVAAWVAAVVDVAGDHLAPAAPGSLTRIRASRRGHRNLISYSDTLHLAEERATRPRKETGCQTSMSS